MTETPSPLTDVQAQTLRDLLALHRSQPGALLPLLHAVQDALGFVPAAAVPVVAQGLGLSRAEVHGVVTYYHFFRQRPPGRHLVQVCRAEACQSRGGEALLAAARQCLPADVTVEPVYCLGLCAQSPAVLIDDMPHAHMTPERLAAAVREVRP